MVMVMVMVKDSLIKINEGNEDDTESIRDNKRLKL